MSINLSEGQRQTYRCHAYERKRVGPSPLFTMTNCLRTGSVLSRARLYWMIALTDFKELRINTHSAYIIKPIFQKRFAKTICAFLSLLPRLQTYNQALIKLEKGCRKKHELDTSCASNQAHKLLPQLMKSTEDRNHTLAWNKPHSDILLTAAYKPIRLRASPPPVIGPPTWRPKNTSDYRPIQI